MNLNHRKDQPGLDKIQIWLKKQYGDLPAKAAVFFGIFFVWAISVVYRAQTDLAEAERIWNAATPLLAFLAFLRAARTEKTDGIRWYINTTVFFVFPVAILPVSGGPLLAIPLLVFGGLVELRNLVNTLLVALDKVLREIDRGGKK